MLCCLGRQLDSVTVLYVYKMQYSYRLICIAIYHGTEAISICNQF